MPAIEQQFQILNKLDIKYDENLLLELWISAKDRQYAKDLLDSEWLGNAKNIIGINIAASQKWQTKNWPLEYIARLCDMLSVNHIRVIITGMKKIRRWHKSCYL